jgi:hypothetical protein
MALFVRAADGCVALNINDVERLLFTLIVVCRSTAPSDAAAQDACAALVALPDGEGERLLAAMDELRALLEQATANETRDRVLDWMLWNVRLVGVTSNLYFWSLQRANPDDMAREAGYQERDWDSLRERVRRVERSYDPVADERMAAYYLRLADSLAEGARIDALDALLNAHREAADPYASAASALYSDTRLSDAAVREEMMAWSPEAFTSSARVTMSKNCFCVCAICWSQDSPLAFVFFESTE